MKILGIIGRSDIPTAHDGSAALIIDNKIKFAIEQERLTRHRYESIITKLELNKN